MLRRPVLRYASTPFLKERNVEKLKMCLVKLAGYMRVPASASFADRKNFPAFKHAPADHTNC